MRTVAERVCACVKESIVMIIGMGTVFVRIQMGTRTKDNGAKEREMAVVWKYLQMGIAARNCFTTINRLIS